MANICKKRAFLQTRGPITDTQPTAVKQLLYQQVQILKDINVISINTVYEVFEGLKFGHKHHFVKSTAKTIQENR